MTAPAARLLPDGERLHLQHGPIDLIIGADGPGQARAQGFAAANRRFATILHELVAELPSLRSPYAQPVQGSVAKRMVAATAPHATRIFLTPMAAVAGAVAEEVLEAMCAAAPLERAYVNNGGDIALHLTPGATFGIAISATEGQQLGRISLRHDHPVRGIATSGQRGRSFSFGIADSVTVLAATAAEADVAATLIANAIDLPDHPGILRVPANEIQPDSDLGTRRVVRHVGSLDAEEVASALRNGAAVAGVMLRAGHIAAGALFLRGQNVTVGHGEICSITSARESELA